MSADISWRELARRRKEDMDGLNQQIDVLEARLATQDAALTQCRGLLRQHVEDVTPMRARVKALEAALTPSGDTKAAYIGEHQIEVEMRDEDGDLCTEMVPIPWATTKDIMAMILKHANSETPS